MKLKVVSFIFFISSLLLFSSCAQTHYAWNGYDQALYDHYKSPGEREQYIEKLKIIIQRAEESGKIPPGPGYKNAQLQGKQTNKNAPGSKQNTGEK